MHEKWLHWQRCASNSFRAHGDESTRQSKCKTTSSKSFMWVINKQLEIWIIYKLAAILFFPGPDGIARCRPTSEASDFVTVFDCDSARRSLRVCHICWWCCAWSRRSPGPGIGHFFQTILGVRHSISKASEACVHLLGESYEPASFGGTIDESPHAVGEDFSWFGNQFDGSYGGNEWVCKRSSIRWRRLALGDSCTSSFDENYLQRPIMRMIVNCSVSLLFVSLPLVVRNLILNFCISWRNKYAIFRVLSGLLEIIYTLPETESIKGIIVVTL